MHVVARRGLTVLLLTFPPLIVACGRGPTETHAQLAPATLAAADASAEVASPSGELRRLTEDEVDAELRRVADGILEDHAQDPIGTEIPFEHEGRRFVAIIEEHDNPEGDPSRPAGKHKGVSLFAPE